MPDKLNIRRVACDETPAPTTVEEKPLEEIVRMIHAMVSDIHEATVKQSFQPAETAPAPGIYQTAVPILRETT